MDFDVDDGDNAIFDLHRSSSTAGKKGKDGSKRVTVTRKKRVFGKSFQRKDSASINSNINANMDNNSDSTPSVSASASQSSSGRSSSQRSDASKEGKSSLSTSTSSSSLRQSKPTQSNKSFRSSTRRRIRQRREEEECDYDFGASALSPASSSCHSSVASPADPVTIVRTNSKRTVSQQLSVRRGVAGFGAYAVQDAGTYQMLHDECSYLCSTILSKNIHPSKAIDAAIELATLLSSRKTRSVLWQGGSTDKHEDRWDEYRSKQGSSEMKKTKSYFDPQSPVKYSKKVSPIPKIWSSIFEVISMAATTRGTLNDVSSSNSSIASSATPSVSSRVDRGLFSRKSRTKSARRKEKALSQGGVCAMGTVGQTSASASNPRSVAPTACKMTCEMKEVLAYITYCISWDCTMSGEQSIAAMGSVNSSSLARKIRMAILERGGILSGIMKLMVTSSPPPSAVTATIGSESNINLPISPLRTATSPPRKRPLTRYESTSSSSTVIDFQSQVDNSSCPAKQTTSSSSNNGGDPTAMGRRFRKKRRRQKIELSIDPLVPPPPSLIVNMDSIPGQMVGSAESEDIKMMPPPRKRRSRHLNADKSDELSFADLSIPKDPSKELGGRIESNGDGSSVLSEAATEGTSVIANRISQKVNELRAKVFIESSSPSDVRVGTTTTGPSTFVNKNRESLHTDRKHRDNNSFFPRGDRPWLSMVCLESMTRILTGKGINGKTSCLEGEAETSNKDEGAEDESDGVDEENNNVLLVTNRLVGKSGIIPLLASAMSQTMIVATKLIFPETDWNISNLNHASENAMEKEQMWDYCHNRLKLLASLIDETCFFSEKNRRSFCEEDPFSFEDQKKGLIVHILSFLEHCSKCDLSQLNQERSETMSLALRTLTSLTHNNPLAAEQMKAPSNSCAEGIRVLANLAFHLEELPSSNSTNSNRTLSKNVRKVTDHDMHRYDGTIFCLTTLANVIEGSGVRRGLMEIQIMLESGASLQWLTWLCQWVMKQTETFRDEILSIGVKTNSNNGSNNINSTGAAFAVDIDGELHKHEEDKLIAAGNGCVVLACLMTEGDDEDPESSATIRKLVEDEMPFDPERNSSPLALVVNTMKAYCNYYHISMGQMSFAVVAPVKKLIDYLEDGIKFDEGKSID